MQDIAITIAQSPLIWREKEVNKAYFTTLISNLQNTDVVVLPEMFTTGFSMDSEDLAEPMEGETVAWMKKLAVTTNLVIAGSIIITEKGNFYNRFLWVQPDGEIEFYDKRHLFRMADENEHFTAGEERKIVFYKGWRICLQVCYDLRFPVWSRNKDDYDVLIYTANWPAVRALPWKILLQARAHENQCYVVGVNRVGTDGKGIEYSGDSAIISPIGEYLVKGDSAKETVETASLSMHNLEAYRTKFPVALDADVFTV